MSKKILRNPDIEERFGWCRVTTWNKVRAGTFPAPIDLGGGKIGWPEAVIDEWVASRPVVPWAPKPEAA